ncbi:MAG: DUF2076 family protein [Azonexus sp.]|nr:DUF2076 family protein [Azonexus sp.]
MNTQEREQLTHFLQQLAQAQVGTKDAEAERLIQETCARQPDSYYLLAQRSLLLEQALGNAQAEIARLQQEQASPRSSAGSFLNSNGWGNSPAQSAPVQRAAAFTPAAATAAPTATPGWGSGMMGTIATTAAGAVAGAFLFQGIGNMMGNHGNNASQSAANTPTPHAAPESLVSNQAEDSSIPPVDLDALGPDDNDSGWG